MRSRPVGPSERPAALVRLLDELRALDRAYSVGHHGRWSAAKRAELVDACLRELFAAIDPPGGVALVALGGYGRGRLAPASDLDLLVAHAPDRASEAAALAEPLLYPLWDAGLRVGHAIRTPQDCAVLAAERLDAATAMLDGRLLAGDDGPWANARAAVLGPVRGDPIGFARTLRADAERRRERFGSVASLLEPDLKEGSGGLRDEQALGWLEIALGMRLEDAGLLRTPERRGVEDAAELLTRVRSALHLETGRAGDRLVLEQHAAVAAGMGFVDEPGLAAVDGLMRSVFEHARRLEHLSASVFGRLLAGPVEPAAVEPTPEGVLRAFVTDAPLPAASLDAVAEVELSQPVRWTPEVLAAFLDLLRAGSVGGRGLEALDRLGLLERYLPAWSAVRCRPQRDPYHRSCVDVHLLETLAGMSSLLERPRDDQLAARAVEVIGRRDAALLGALLHDIGKTGQGDHVPVGTRIARETLDRMGVVGPDRELALFLVREHLLLSNTATRRDLEDDDLVLDVAARVGEPERLAALYLLTVADARATGPLAWTPWRATLVRELVAKVDRVLERGEVGLRTATDLAERTAAIRAALAGADPAAVERFLTRVPRGYVLAVPPERAARDLALATPPIGALEVRTRSGPSPRGRASELTVVAADRPGLLAMIAGALSLSRLSILQAQVFTTEDGMAVDLFEVEGAFEEEVGEERWREFRGILRRALDGRLSLEERVRDKRRYYPPSRHDVPVRVGVDNDASDFFTVIEVHAPDRLGVLFDLTHTLNALGLDVHLAKVATLGERIVDVFYVRDPIGRKVEIERVAAIERALTERLTS